MGDVYKNYNNIINIDELKTNKKKRKDYSISQTINEYCRPDFFKITTTSEFKLFEIVEYIDLVYGEIVIPNGLVGWWTTGTFYSIEALDRARKEAVKLLLKNAKKIGANAIIGLDIDICDLANNGMMVSANGTAVKIVLSDEVIEYSDEMESRNKGLRQLDEVKKESDRIATEEARKKQEETRKKIEEATKIYEEQYVEGLNASDVDIRDGAIQYFINSSNKKSILLDVISSLDGEFSINELLNQFDNKVPLMDLAPYVQAFLDEGKIGKNEQTKMYYVINK